MEDLNYRRVFNLHEVKSASVVCLLLLLPLGADFFSVLGLGTVVLGVLSSLAVVTLCGCLCFVSVSSSRYRGLGCGLCLWHFLIIHGYLRNVFLTLRR